MTLPPILAPKDYAIDASGVTLADNAQLVSPIVGAARLIQGSAAAAGSSNGLLRCGNGNVLKGLRLEIAPRPPNLQGVPIIEAKNLTAVNLDISGIWDNFTGLAGTGSISNTILKTCYDSLRNVARATYTISDTLFFHGVPVQGYVRYCYADYDGHYIFNRCIFVCTLAPTDLTTKYNALIANSDPAIDPASSGPSIIELNDCIIAAMQGVTQLRQNGSGRIIVRRTQYNPSACLGNIEKGI